MSARSTGLAETTQEKRAFFERMASAHRKDIEDMKRVLAQHLADPHARAQMRADLAMAESRLALCLRGIAKLDATGAVAP